MAERQSGPEDSRNRFKFTQKMAAGISAGIGAFYGGASYGVTRLVSPDGQLAKDIGLGTGVGIAAITGGLLGAIAASKDAEKLAIQGKVGKARLKALQSTLESLVGVGGGGALAGFKAGGSEGAIYGGLAGTLCSTPGFLLINRGLKKTGEVYRNVIHPTLDPHNFPQFNIVKDSLFDDKDVLLEHPPVYDAGSITEMKGFREAQVNAVIEKASSMRGVYKNPDMILFRMPSAIFIIPDLIHYPAFDPKEDSFVLALKQPATSMKLADTQNDSITVKSYTGSSNRIWPNPTEFENDPPLMREFNGKRWDYWRERNWRHQVAVLASRNINRTVDKRGNTISFEANDSYHLVDILVGGTGKGERIKKRQPKKVRLKGLVPEADPNSI